MKGYPIFKKPFSTDRGNQCIEIKSGLTCGTFVDKQGLGLLPGLVLVSSSKKMRLFTIRFALASMALLFSHCAQAPKEQKTPAGYEAVQVDLSVDSDAKMMAEGSALRFPSSAQSAGKSGYVELSIWVDTAGRVREVNILKEDPMGYGFADAARDHAYRLTFTPAVSKKKRVSQWFHRKYEFNLNAFHLTKP